MDLLLYTLATFLVGFSLVAVIRFLLRWRVVRHSGRVTTIPLHVWLVSLSYNLLVVGMVIDVYQRSQAWHPYVFLPALITGIYGMIVLVKAQKPPTKESRDA